jgi:hypothetical protein
MPRPDSVPFVPVKPGETSGSKQKTAEQKENERLLRLKIEVQMLVVKKIEKDLQIKGMKRNAGDEGVSLEIDPKQSQWELEAMDKYLADYSLLFNALFERPRNQVLATSNAQAAADRIFERIQEIKPMFDALFPSKEQRAVMVNKPSSDDLSRIRQLVAEDEGQDEKERTIN